MDVSCKNEIYEYFAEKQAGKRCYGVVAILTAPVILIFRNGVTLDG